MILSISECKTDVQSTCLNIFNPILFQLKQYGITCTERRHDVSVLE